MPTPVYDVTTFVSPSSTSPYTDIGKVINEILTDVASYQTSNTTRPGAVIYIPPGHYDLLTTVEINQSFIQIKGSGHGFLSLGIMRYAPYSTANWVERAPGGSHIRIVNNNTTAFLIRRLATSGQNGPQYDGRLNSIEFRDFCIDGDTFPSGSLYQNGKVGIAFSNAGNSAYFSDNDSCRIEGMGMVFLERGIVAAGADAMTITGNFICECGNGVEFVNKCIATAVTNNSFGTGYIGFTVFADDAERLIVSGNQMFPNGKSMVHLKNSKQCTISSNMMQSYGSGMVVFEGSCSENSVLANHFTRDYNSAGPTVVDDLFGLVHINGNDNAVTGNLFTLSLTDGQVTPSGNKPTVVLVKSGYRNYLASNYFRGGALSSNAPPKVVLDASTRDTNVLYSARSAEFLAYSGATYTFQPTG